MISIQPLDKKFIKPFILFRNQSAKDSEYLNNADYSKTLEIFKEHTNSKNKYGCLLFDSDTNEVVGQLFTRLDPKHSSVLIISLISVSNNRQGSGLGSKLIEEAKRIAIEKFKAKSIELFVHPNNTNAIKFYNNKGFKFKKQHSRQSIIMELNLK